MPLCGFCVEYDADGGKLVFHSDTPLVSSFWTDEALAALVEAGVRQLELCDFFLLVPQI